MPAPQITSCLACNWTSDAPKCYHTGMIGFISCVVSIILCTFVYVRMVKREEPMTLGKKSIIPVALGLVVPIITTFLVILINLAVRMIAGDSSSVHVPNQALSSLANAFLGAGFPEELLKLLFALLVVAIVRPKTVYAYALMFIGVGFGFTALEEFLYGGGNDLLSLARLPGFALHMVFGMMMGVNLGLARYRKKQGTGSTSKLVLTALIIPVLWHTIYDAATVDNVGIEAESDIALAIALAVDIATIVLQFVLLVKFRKKSKVLCQMEF